MNRIAHHDSTPARRAATTLRRIARALLMLALVLAPLLLTAHGAHAGGAGDEADLHFQIAAEHYQKGEFREALEHFLASNRLVPNKNVVFNIARTYEQLRKYDVAHRYYLDALEAESGNAQTVNEIKAAIKRISPYVAVLRVETTPPGATIYIDRKDLGSRGKSPRPLAVAEGKYKVIAELDGYEAASAGPIEVKLGAEAVVPLTLRRIVGTVHVTVEGAPSAEVHLDDERSPSICTAPCDVEVPPGQHLFYFTREGFQGTPRQLNVIAKESVKVTATLSTLTGSLVVSADEREALVEIDGRPSGFTPAVIQNVAVGTRKVRVSLRGYTAVERDVVVKANEQSQLLDLRLTPLRQVSAVSRYAESIEDAPSSVSIIDSQELRAFGYPTIAEALRGTRGVYLTNDRAYVSAGIRGLGEPNDYGNRVLVLTDGASLNDNLLNSSYIGSDGRVDLHDIERIEVVRGPGSLLYGTGAFSGVINLVPKGKDEPNGVHLGVGTYDDAVMRGRVGFNYNFTKGVGMWASLSGARSNGVDVPIDLIDPGTGPKTQTTHNVDYFRSVGTAGRFWAGPVTAQWFFHQREQHLPIGAFGTLFNDNRSFYKDERMLAEVRYEPVFNEYVQLATRVHGNRYIFHSDLAYDPAPGKPLTEDYRGTWFGAEARVIVTPIKQLRITGGGEAQFHPEASIVGGEPTPYVDINKPYNFGAGYVILEGSPSDWFRVSAGARLDVYSTFGPIFVPRAALIFKPVKGGVLKLMGGRAFRAPSIYEQFYTDGEHQFPGNQGKTVLKPESVYTGEIEYSQRFLEDWVATAAVHVSYVQNIINTLEDPNNPGGVSYQNSPDPALAAGGDIELRREWRQGWMVSAMYGYQYARFLSDADKNPRLVNAPEHLASFKGVVPVVSDVAALGLRITLEAPRKIGATSDETTNPNVVADLTVSGGVKKFGVGYAIGVYNVLDSKYRYPVTETYLSRTALQNGRTFMADLMVTYP